MIPASSTGQGNFGQQEQVGSKKSELRHRCAIVLPGGFCKRAGDADCSCRSIQLFRLSRVAFQKRSENHGTGKGAKKLGKRSRLQRTCIFALAAVRQSGSPLLSHSPRLPSLRPTSANRYSLHDLCGFSAASRLSNQRIAGPGEASRFLAGKLITLRFVFCGRS